jgi:hypothetical protein
VRREEAVAVNLDQLRDARQAERLGELADIACETIAIVGADAILRVVAVTI